MRDKMELDLEKLFFFVVRNSRIDSDSVNHYWQKLSAVEKNKVVNAYINNSSRKYNVCNNHGKKDIGEIFVKYMRHHFIGNSIIKPITSFDILQNDEIETICEKVDFEIDKALYLFDSSEFRVVIELSFNGYDGNIWEANVLDPYEKMLAKNKYVALAEMNKLMAEQG